MSYKWVPVIDANMCSGCQECVYACERNCLELLEGTAVLTKPTLCGSDGNCIAPCPSAAIEMRWMETLGDDTVGKWKG